MRTRYSNMLFGLLPAVLLWTTTAHAQVPVDDDGNVIGRYEEQPYDAYSTERATGNEGIPLLDQSELQELVGPVALYPDDLLAVVLPASTYPLQVVQAARFLEDLKSNPELKPDPEWDDSIIALINYPEVVELLNEDLDWTWRLGEAVVAQQADVVSAVEEFRNRAYAAGNLKSDDYQTVTADEGVIEIVPVNEDVIYVPYYEPARVVYYQPRPVYYYYPRPCPVYYYPYPSSYSFNRGYFWGVTTAFSIGWRTDHLSVFHHSYRGHPYYGARYWDRWWYRRPSIHVHNRIYVNNHVSVSTTRYRSGDRWRPSRSTRLRYSDQRISRNTYQPQRERNTAGFADNRRQSRSTRQSTDARRRQEVRRFDSEAIRNDTANVQRRQASQERNAQRETTNQRRRSTTSRQSEDIRRRQAIERNDYRTDRNGTANAQRRQTAQGRNAQREATSQRRPSTTTRQSVQRQTTERRQSSSSNDSRRQQVQRQQTQRQRAPAPVVRERRSTPVQQPAERRQSYARAERRTQPAAQSRQPATTSRSQKQTTQRRSQSSESTQRRSSSSRRSTDVSDKRRRQ